MHCHRSRRAHRALRRQRGAALIVAMLVFALATALVVAMKSEFERFYQRSANILLEEQAQAYLRGAEELAGLVLLADYDQDKTRGVPRDDLSEAWHPDPTTGPPTYPLDGTAGCAVRWRTCRGASTSMHWPNVCRTGRELQRAVLRRPRNSLFDCCRPWGSRR